MADSKVCPSCGHANSLDARFCGRCGSALAFTAAPVAPAPVAPAPLAPAASSPGGRGGVQKTMMGAIMDPIPALAAPEPPAALPPPAKPAPKQPMRTMLGGGFEGIADLVKAVDAGGLPPAPTPIAAPAAAAPAVAPAPFVPPAASSTAGLARSPIAGSPAMVQSDSWGAQPIDARAMDPRAPTPAAEPAIPRRDAMRTMLGAGLDAAPLPAAVASPSPVASPAPVAPPSPVATPSPAAAQPPPVEPVHHQPIQASETDPSQSAPMAALIAEPMAATPPTSAQAGATLEGIAAPVVPAAPPAAGNARARTMLGMAAPMFAAVPPSTAAPTAQPTAQPIAPPIAQPPAAPAPVEPVAQPPAVAAAPAQAPSKRAAALGPSNRTMLGVAAPARAGAAAPAAFGGAPEPMPPPPAAPQVALPTASSTSTGDLSIAGLPSPRRRARGWFFALLFVGVMLVGSVIVAAAYYRMTRARTDVVASVGTSPAGEVLHVAVSGAPDGTHVRFSGADLPLGAGGADFPLAAEALHVGDNAIAVDVVFADGSSETHQVTLTVEYRIRADLASIGATPPAITVVIDAVPGSTVVLDAQPFALDAAGHGTRVCPIDGLTPAADGTIEHVAHYVITPPAPAVPATGALTTRAPVVTLHIDRPADGAVTDRATVDIAGAVSPGATVTVEGGAATVTAEGRFTATVPLATDGDNEIHLSASAPGRVVSSRTIHVRRVPDLAREAAAFPIDRSLTYARIAAAPATFQGQHVAIEGRVYNVDLQDGHGVLQLLARDCPSGERCPLWVTYSAVTEVTVESWVRVVGSVAGEQQFRSQAGEVRTVPRVEATFVLPARP